MAGSSGHRRRRRRSAQGHGARNILKGYRPHQSYWPSEYIPAKREAAWRKFQPKFDADPDLRSLAEASRRYFANRH